MKTYILVALTVGLTGLTAVVGAVHGRLTNRWGPQTDMLEAARKLESTPKEIEGWELVREDPLSEGVVEMLQCSGYVNRTYRNEKTGDRISVVVLLGPAGPIAVHTPEICYSSRDYKITDQRTACEVGDSEKLWDLTLKSKGVVEAPLRVLYGWTNNGKWDATPDPRFAFGGRPFLYKIQMAGPVTQEHDACQDFLASFLPVLRHHLVDGS